MTTCTSESFVFQYVISNLKVINTDYNFDYCFVQLALSHIKGRMQTEGICQQGI
jgi:hypothetical protein